MGVFFSILSVARNDDVRVYVACAFFYFLNNFSIRNIAPIVNSEGGFRSVANFFRSRCVVEAVNYPMYFVVRLHNDNTPFISLFLGVEKFKTFL